jgi:hypothetical protein
MNGKEMVEEQKVKEKSKKENGPTPKSRGDLNHHVDRN